MLLIARRATDVNMCEPCRNMKTCMPQMGTGVTKNPERRTNRRRSSRQSRVVGDGNTEQGIEPPKRS